MLSIYFLIGWIMDLMFGDPVRLPHPIVYFGRMISASERMLNKGGWRRTKGGIMAVTLISFVFIATWGTFHIAAYMDDAIGASSLRPVSGMLTSVCVFYCLAGTTLAREVRWVFDALTVSLDNGRKQVARIVGRDTTALTEQEVKKAALETLAENLSDGVIAPMLWFLILGAPGMMAYKMVNTLDSMIGYHNERYIRFGTIAARIDDVANYVPARLSAFLMSALSGKNVVSLLKFVARYGKEHASPNSGYPEAALAGILNCRFGGPHHYFGEYFYKPYIGHNEREITYEDMTVSIAINRKAEVAMAAIVIITMLIVN